MLNFGLRKTYGPIGLDIGHDTIKMTQLTLAQGTLKLSEARKSGLRQGEGESVGGTSVVQVIKALLEEGDFQGRDCISCLPNSKLKITSVRVDQADQAKTGASLYKEAAYRFGLDPDTDSIRYIPVGQVRQGNALKQEMILFATDQDTIKQHIDMLEAAGLVPMGIDPLPCALFRGLTQLRSDQADQENTVVYVDVGSRYTTIALGREGQLCFVKQIAVGAERFDQVISDKLGVERAESHALRLKRQRQTEYDAVIRADPTAPPLGHGRLAQISETTGLEDSTRQTLMDGIRSVAGELAHELARCLRYYTVTFLGQRIHYAVLCGGGANEGILLEVLRAQLGCQVVTADAVSADMGTQLKALGRRDEIHEWVVSIGLALKNLPRVSERPSETVLARPLAALGQETPY